MDLGFLLRILSMWVYDWYMRVLDHSSVLLAFEVMFVVTSDMIYVYLMLEF